MAKCNEGPLCQRAFRFPSPPLGISVIRRQNAFGFSVGRNAPFARSSMAMEAGAAQPTPQRGGVKNTPHNHTRKRSFSIFRLDRVGQHAASLFRRM